MSNWMKPRLMALAAFAILSCACTRTMEPVLDPNVYIGSQTPVEPPEQNDQLLRVTVLDGAFDANTYEEQSGATRMLVMSTDGPYLFEVDNLVERRELPAYGAVVINYDTTAPGRYTMRAYLSTSSGTSPVPATAVLDIAPVGSR